VPAYLVSRHDRKKNIPVKWLPALLRFLTFFSTAALLLAPAFSFKRNETEKPVMLWLQDKSTSFAYALGKDTSDYHNKVQHLLKQWEGDYTVVPLAFGGDVTHDNIFNYNARSTDISNALQSALEQYRDRNIGAIVLPTDGIYNEGLDPLYLPLGGNIPVYTIAVGDSAQPEDISVARVFANKTVAAGSVFEVIADIRADKLKGLSTHVDLLQGNSVLKQAPLNVDKDRYITSVRFEVTAKGKGFQKFSIAVPRAANEVNERNNKMDFFVNVIDDATKILILTAAPHPDVNAIRDALESVPQYKVDVRTGNDFPADAGKYNLVIAYQSPDMVKDRTVLKQTPVWYILGSQSNLNVVNQVENTLTVAGAGRLNDALPLLNSTFSYFTLPPNIREVLAKLPPLQSPNGNYTAAGNAQVLFRQQIGSVSTNYPLWVIQMGETPQAVLAGEGLWRWRLYEYKNFKDHNVVDELIRQTVSLLCVRKDNQPFRVFMDKYVLNDNEPAYIYAELRNANAELVNTPEAKLEIKDSIGKALQYTFEKSGSGYRLNLGLLAPGNYTFTGNTQYAGKSYQSSGAFVVESMPLESLRTNADYQMLYQLSKNTGGRFFTYNNFSKALSDSLKANPNISAVIHTNETHEPLINKKWLFFLILLFAAGEWLLRKYWSV
jgi:hypothetical protein